MLAEPQRRWFCVLCPWAQRRGFPQTCVADQLARPATAKSGEEARNFGIVSAEEAGRHYEVARNNSGAYLTVSREQLTDFVTVFSVQTSKDSRAHDCSAQSECCVVTSIADGAIHKAQYACSDPPNSVSDS